VSGTASSRRSREPAERRRWLEAARAAAGWILVVAASTSALWALRGTLDKAHMALAFLLIVLMASARHGRRVGLSLAVVSFLCFNFFLLPPYHTFRIADPLDWGVLAAFLITGAVAAQLLYRAQRQTWIAQQRADEIDRLSVLGAETLNAGRAEDAVIAIARVIQSTLRLVVCEIWVYEADADEFWCAARVPGDRLSAGDPPQTELFAEALGEGVIGVEPAHARPLLTSHRIEQLATALRERPDSSGVIVPLSVRGRGVGLLRMRDRVPMGLDAAQERFAQVLSYYAALGVERIQLVADADRVHALREADRLREALIAGISHDLRTPLTTIKALACELRVTGDDRAVIIEEEADRLNALVTDLLDLSRLNAGALSFSPELTAGEDLLGTAIQRVEGARAGREIIASLPAADTIPIGRFDFGHSVRALVNLLENALKYSPATSPIEVRLERDGDFLAFAVLDRGAGVAAGESERIFEPFYRPPAVPPDTGGTGLGLAIARRLAEVQGGSVRYAARPDGGSIFTLLLPAADLPPDAAAGAATASLAAPPRAP
jgi:two-component system, OmpR family, sensor histidine kinase KdpD